MTARRQFLNDGAMRRSDQMLGREQLLLGRDVVCLARKQIYWDLDILQRQLSPQADELALGEAVLLEQLLNGLQIVAARQIDCVLVPSLEPFAARDVALVRDVCIEVDVFL